MLERANRADLKLVTAVPDDLPPFECDPAKLRQVLMALLSNALKFTEAGGTVTVEASRGESGDLTLRVSDTGIGIAAEDIERVLHPFGQVDSALSRKYEGIGLGLPLSRALVELHGGTLSIESTPGIGTGVTIRLPGARFESPA
jgi:signal transduction histidine kinase